MMASDGESEVRLPNGVIDHVAESPIGPSTPQAPPESSQVTLPSTEIPQSPPMDLNASFRTEMNDDRADIVIPSSLTPPPSTQIGLTNGSYRRTFSHSQQSNYVSPPATVPHDTYRRGGEAAYVPPTQQQVMNASVTQLRDSLLKAVSEYGKLEAINASSRLQYGLICLEGEQQKELLDVESQMHDREIDLLRQADHLRDAKQDLQSLVQDLQHRHQVMAVEYEKVLALNRNLEVRLKGAKHIIQDQDWRCQVLEEQKEQLANRLQEKSENWRRWTRPGGIFHASPPQQQQPPAPLRQLPNDGNHLNTLLEAINHDNNSAPSTPIVANRPMKHPGGRHNRNAQSMSALPTTPINRILTRESLLPSVRLVPQTEPPKRVQRPAVQPTMTPPTERRRRKSRESTISEDDNEELARQALKSVEEAAQSFASASRVSQDGGRSQRYGAGSDAEDQELYGSQASQAATELLRRDPRASFEVKKGTESEAFSNVREKRKFSGQHEPTEDARSEQWSPPKKTKTGQAQGLGIQYR